MNLEERLDTIKRTALKKIEEAAKTGDTSIIFFNTSAVEKVEQFIRRLEEIRSGIDRLEKELGAGQDQRVRFTPLDRDLNKAIPGNLSSRMKGEIRRNDFVKNLSDAGINLIHKGGSRFEKQTGGLVGIAYASERKPDRWFLGLPLKEYSSLVLLCENEKGEVVAFILPQDFYQRHKKQFSNVNGQIKFNIVLRGGRYQMTIPEAGNVTLNEFQDKYNTLRR